jgi:SAM-dependent methyltransferase
VRPFLALVALALLQSAPVYVPYADVPAEAGSHPRITRDAWPVWVAKRDAEIRGRLARGDEDSLVYLWLYGTSFTKQPRATAEYIASLRDAGKAEALLIDRLDDLVSLLADAAGNERLEFARRYLANKGIDVATAAGRMKAREFLVKARERVVAENAELRRAAERAARAGPADATLGGWATLFRDRGLSSDTRLVASFAIDAALDAVAQSRTLPSRSVRRAAVVGPGLDFTDKAEGYDFYPQQTIQPFALIDTLLRLGLADLPPGGGSHLDLTTYDVSPRVNAHLAAAASRASGGSAYTLQLPRPADGAAHEWQPALVRYWEAFGERIGRPVAPAPLPAGLTGVRIRSLSVNPVVVRAIAPKDLNIIVQREPLAEPDRYDLIVATNVLVYYDAFEQALALSNIASMLRPGGLFLTNYAVAPSAQMEALPQLTTRVFFDTRGNGDSVFSYRRR